MRRTAKFIIAVSLASAAARGAVPATTSQSGRRIDAAAARHPAIQSALVDLTKEVESALRSGEDPPRAHPDYFPAVVAADLPTAAVIAALRRPIHADPRVAAYVKWQLLSGLPKELDEQTAAELLQAYRVAPAPLPRPGTDAAQRDELERMIRKAKEADADALTEQFEQMHERVERDNAPILKYRDALFARLPATHAALAAGFDDLAVRLNAGTADVADHARAVCKALSAWAADAPADQLKIVARAIAQLERKKGQEYYSRLYWSDSNARLQWTKTRPSLASVAQLEEAREFLEDRIKNPAAPLKLKEEW